MASLDALFWNVCMASVVSLYVFGGEKPWVSQTTALAVGILQIYSLLTAVVVNGAIQAPKKMKGFDEEDVPMAQQCSSIVATYASKIVQHTALCRFGGMAAVLVMGRFLRTSGLMTTASQAIPLALGLGALLSMAVARFWPESEGDEDETEEEHYPLGGDKSPYSVKFWSELEPAAVTTDPIDDASLDSDKILSDVLHNLYMK